MTLLTFSTVLNPDRDGTPVLGTLGPAGTSSEVAATLLGRRLVPGGGSAPVRLYDTYEEAGEALRDGRVSHVVVADAYQAVHHFYMDPLLALANVFVMDTPLYGIARRRGAEPVLVAPAIASHPAPVPLIRQLLPSGHTSPKVIEVDSTSAAARAVADGAVDLALTTESAVRLHGLEFISETRPIRMAWSVFVRSAAASRSGRVA